MHTIPLDINSGLVLDCAPGIGKCILSLRHQQWTCVRLCTRYRKMHTITLDINSGLVLDGAPGIGKCILSP